MKAAWQALDAVRKLRNAFMHAKEQEQDQDIDATTLMAGATAQVAEEPCRNYPIVIRENIQWMGDLEVP